MIDNFIYDGVSLNDMGFILISFDGGQDGTIDTDSQRTFNHLSMFRGAYQPFTYSTYEEPLKMEFWIMSNPCGTGSTVIDNNNNNNITTSDGGIRGVENTEYVYSGDNNQLNISISQMAQLKKWLNRPYSHRLRLDSEEYSDYYWEGSFNIEEEIMGNNRIGAHLTFECDAPYGWKQQRKITGTVSANNSFTITSDSDDVGFLLPELKLIIKSDGDLELMNDMDNKIIKVNNCISGETLSFTKYMQLQSSNSKHDLGKDFNFIFPKIYQEFNYGDNVFTTNLPVEYTLTYDPIAKVVIV